MDEIEGYEAKLSLLSEKNQVCTKLKRVTQTRMFRNFFGGEGGLRIEKLFSICEAVEWVESTIDLGH